MTLPPGRARLAATPSATGSLLLAAVRATLPLGSVCAPSGVAMAAIASVERDPRRSITEAPRRWRDAATILRLNWYADSPGSSIEGIVEMSADQDRRTAKVAVDLGAAREALLWLLSAAADRARSKRNGRRSNV